MVGCDIVKITRFEKMKLESFLKKYFTESETQYVLTKKNVEQTVAGLYACKEAVLKAFGCGIGGELKLKDVEIFHDKNGAPQVSITKKMELQLKKHKKSQIFVSISHDGEYAFSVCQIL